MRRGVSVIFFFGFLGDKLIVDVIYTLCEIYAQKVGPKQVNFILEHVLQQTMGIEVGKSHHGSCYLMFLLSNLVNISS